MLPLLICASGAAAATLPDFDITAYCKSEPNLTDVTVANCIDRENKSHELASRLIDAIPEADIDACIHATPKPGLGPYLSLAICIELNPNFGHAVTKRTEAAPAPSAAPAPIATPDKAQKAESLSCGPDGASDPSCRANVSPENTGSLRPESPAPRAAKLHFDRDLSVGSVGPDVRQLQIFLNANGFRVADSGPGSPGREVDTFGRDTETALIKFQNAHAAELLIPFGLTKGTGFLGRGARKFINAM